MFSGTPFDFAVRDQMLAKLAKHVQHWKQMDNVFKSKLPLALLKRCHAVRINEDAVLIIFADSGTVASRLKLLAPTLLPVLDVAGFHAKSVLVKVVLSERQSSQENRLSISDTALAAISEGAKHISNKNLANALLNLVKNYS